MNRCKRCDVQSDEDKCFVCGKRMAKHEGESTRNPYIWKSGQRTVEEEWREPVALLREGPQS